MQQLEQLDRYVPAHIQVWIEQTYYARINISEPSWLRGWKEHSDDHD